MTENKSNLNPFSKPQFKNTQKPKEKKQLPISTRYCSNLLEDIPSENISQEQPIQKYKIPGKIPPSKPTTKEEEQSIDNTTNQKEEIKPKEQPLEEQEIDNLSEPIKAEPEAEINIKLEEGNEEIIENIFNIPPMNSPVKSDKSINKQATNGIGIGESENLFNDQSEELNDDNKEEEEIQPQSQPQTQLQPHEIQVEQDNMNDYQHDNNAENTELKFEITVNNNSNPFNSHRDQQQHDINQEQIDGPNNSSPQTTESKEIISETVEKFKEENKDANGNGNDIDNNQEREQIFQEHKEIKSYFETNPPKEYCPINQVKIYSNDNDICDLKMQREIQELKAKIAIIDNEKNSKENELKRARDEIKKQKEIINHYIRKELNEGESVLKKQIEILTNASNGKDRINEALINENKRLKEYLDNRNQYIKEYIEKTDSLTDNNNIEIPKKPCESSFGRALNNNLSACKLELNPQEKQSELDNNPIEQKEINLPLIINQNIHQPSLNNNAFNGDITESNNNPVNENNERKVLSQNNKIGNNQPIEIQKSPLKYETNDKTSILTKPVEDSNKGIDKIAGMNKQSKQIRIPPNQMIKEMSIPTKDEEVDDLFTSNSNTNNALFD